MKSVDEPMWEERREKALSSQRSQWEPVELLCPAPPLKSAEETRQDHTAGGPLMTQQNRYVPSCLSLLLLLHLSPESCREAVALRARRAPVRGLGPPAPGDAHGRCASVSQSDLLVIIKGGPPVVPLDSREQLEATGRGGEVESSR
ncbi:unnamed protein product [Pleuronectes platessa]|uniref:Uncharacterized protein n=1 Tax=Pleuronectes platessa TaxID=8262 RepID=A0A9N7YU44_PLEPL|nr:unnamed protein product [Pleuronectes platessa]